jgi:hypothetical protein
LWSADHRSHSDFGNTTELGESQMKGTIRITMFVVLAVAALCVGQAFAGRGGGGGHGGGGYHSGGASFHGGSASFHSGDFGHAYSGHTPSFSASGTRSISHPVTPSHANPVYHSWTGAGVHPGPHPNVGPHPYNRPIGPNWANHDWYHGNWNGHWNHPWYPGPATWFGAGLAVGAAITPWSWGYWPYDNPYYTAPIVVGDTTIDYSQPIVAAGQYDAPAEQVETQTASENQFLDAARDAFAQGDYQTALSQVNQAIAKQPNDQVAHEFRALVCFADKKYKEAAAGVYAVLSVGPGWDWTTLTGFYPDVDVYTKQLRALEAYVNAHPSEADVRFLLAYQYLTCGYTDAAATQLKAAAKLNPKDRLASQLLSSLSAPASDATPAPATPPAPAKPVDAASLVGSWKADQPDGSSISLRLSGDSKYTWRFTRQGKTQEYSGTYTFADNLLILKQGNTPAMVGQVASSGNGGFNFKLANSGPSDPGLMFRQ